MRTREKYQILLKATDENHNLILKTRVLPDERSHFIENSKQLCTVYRAIKNFPWSIVDDEYHKTQIKEILERDTTDNMILSQEQYEILRDWAKNANNHLQTTVDVLHQTFSEKGSYTISIKLPKETITDLKKLNTFNKEVMDSLEKLVLERYHGRFEFAGFDTGSDWIDIVIVGLEGKQLLTAYAGVLGVIFIAQKSMELRTEYHKGNQAKYDALIAKQSLQDKQSIKLENITERDIKEHINKKVKIQIREELDKLVEKTQLGNEDATSFEKALDILVEHMEQGAEYHPSLNPPENLIMEDGNEICYEKLHELLEQEKQKQVNDKNDIELLENKNE